MVMPEFPWEIVRFLKDTTGVVDLERLINAIPFKVETAEVLIAQTWVRKSRTYGLIHTTEMIVPLVGSCDLMLNDGVSWRDLNITDLSHRGETRAVVIKPGVWRELTAFAPGTTLLILSSSKGVGDEKIMDWAQFMDEIGKPGKAKGRE